MERVRGNNPIHHFGMKSPLSVAGVLCNTGESPRDILPLHHRDATIAIVFGKQPTGTGYVEEAYFNPEDAHRGLRELQARECATAQKGMPKFCVVTANIGHLEELAVVNPLTGEFLSEIDRLAVYSSLTERLR